MNKARLVGWISSICLFVGSSIILSSASFEGSKQIGFTLLTTGLIQITLSIIASEIESLLRKAKQ